MCWACQESDRERITGSFATVAAPFDGMVTEKMVEPVHDEDYSSREGYQQDFMEVSVPLPDVTDLELVRAEGLAMGPAPKQRALETAADHVAGLDAARELTVAA